MNFPFQAEYDDRIFESRLRAISSRRPFLLPEADVPGHYRRSSVLICFWRQQTESGNPIRVLFTKRASSLRGHPGQMSFPGGQLDEGEDWIAAALRETEEEVGIERDRVQVLGRLDDAWSGAGHLLVPVVGWLDAIPRCTPNPAEVAEIHTPSVHELIEPGAFECEEAQIGDQVYFNPIIDWESGRAFGLSADLLIEALQWGLGIPGEHGPNRLASLRSYAALKARQEEEKSTPSSAQRE